MSITVLTNVEFYRRVHKCKYCEFIIYESEADRLVPYWAHTFLKHRDKCPDLVDRFDLGKQSDKEFRELFVTFLLTKEFKGILHDKALDLGMDKFAKGLKEINSIDLYINNDNMYAFCGYTSEKLINVDEFHKKDFQTIIESFA